MTDRGFTESVVEQAALAWLESLDWSVTHGLEIAPGEAGAERADYAQVILEARLREALARLNPALPPEALDDAFRRLTRPEGAELSGRNRAVHRLLVEGVTVEYRAADGEIRGAQARVLDFDDPQNNDWLAVNQFTVTENKHTRRPDVVLFINGLPLTVIELKNAADEDATIWTAFQQLQTYKAELPSLFAFNEVLLVSDGVEARVGTLTAGREWMKPWRTITGERLADSHLPELQVSIEGLFAKQRFLDLVRDFVVFEDAGGGKLAKKMAGYHQFHAVQVAVGETLRAAELARAAGRVAESGGHYEAGQKPGGQPGDRRVGVVWHTQGSGKSLSMAFYSGKLIQQPEMANPTLVVLTDRNDLDDQLFGTFAACHELLHQVPVQAESRADLRRKLQVASGGVVFTTIQKFMPDEQGDVHPLLSDRENVVVIADEAHRSQYDFIDGFARHLRDALPNASFIGFTGTPIELTDKNTRAVFGDYIDTYDIQRAVEDGATVSIFYEARLAKIELPEELKPRIDAEFMEVTEGEEVLRREKLKSTWARVEAMVGTDRRLALVVKDLVEHFEARQAGNPATPAKGMVVCMSRRICVDLYAEIVKLRPEWHSAEAGAAADDDAGAVKVVMTGSAADELDWQQHIRNKPRREALAHRFKDPDDDFKLVIVRDMWLTGFDAPSLTTMYVDKPMRGHGLMQAIARVNRVFRDKQGGLVVDYLGIADQLKRALHDYTDGGGKGDPVIDQSQAIAVMQEKYEIVCDMLHGLEYAAVWVGGTHEEKLQLIGDAKEFILGLDDGKQRFVDAVTALGKAFSLAVPSAEAIAIRDEVGFFQTVRAALMKTTIEGLKSDEELDLAVRQIVSRAVSSDEVVDIFAVAGLERPDISVLDDRFLAEVRDMPRRNLAVELLQKLLHDEIKTRFRRNLVESRAFSEMLQSAVIQYQNRAITSAQVIEELIRLAKELREAHQRGEELGLSEDELAFYDALETNDSAVAVLGDATLKLIAQELVETVKRNATIDWNLRESARAKMRIMVKRLLRKHGYPPDKQEHATQLVLAQAEVLCEEWAA